MITLLNHDSNNWDKYNVLFKKAWKYLFCPDPKDPTKTLLKPEDKADADDNGKEAFSNLAHYFAYIKELIAHDPLYLMLPIDEKPFEINADTREIDVPPAFSKCSGIQSDNYAEIITFTIDRYFDYKDLATADIAIQWINEASGTEGVSFIQLIDLETYGDENKIRFGWPLTSEMTAAAGNLRFAVRFYTAQTDEAGIIKFNYLFNTSPASISIKPTLSIDFNSVNIVKKDNDLALFTSYIENSMNPSYGIPTSIQFILEDDEFPQYGRINLESDTLTLKAQAITKDLNPLIYEWYRKIGDQIDLITSDEAKYTISSNFELYDPDPWPSTRPTMTFWVADAITGSYPYTPYFGEWPEENPNNLYIMKTSLTFVKDGGDVTGEYYVKAINQVADLSGEVINSVDQDSRVCVILAPADINITKNLDNHMFLDANTNTLTIELEADGAHPQRFYNVYHSDSSFTVDDIVNMTPINDNPKTEDIDLIPIEDGVNTITHTLESGAFGYYLIQPISKLNRSIKDNVYSNVCYVSDKPGTPIGTMLIDGENPLDRKDENDIPVIEGELHSSASFQWLDSTKYNNIRINAKGTSGQIMTLKVDTPIQNGSAYNTGEITYKWTKTLEGVTEEIPNLFYSNEGEVESLRDNVLTIRVLMPESGIYSYTCQAFNTIENVSVESEVYSFTIV